MQILNRALQTALPQHGAALEFWRKVFLDTFGGTAFETTSGHRFELHFYRDVANCWRLVVVQLMVPRTCYSEMAAVRRPSS
jgi:hypothetical protein